MAAAVEDAVEVDVDLDKLPECAVCGSAADLKVNFHGCNHLLKCNKCEAVTRENFAILLSSCRWIRCSKCFKIFTSYSEWVTVRPL